MVLFTLLACPAPSGVAEPQQEEDAQTPPAPVPPPAPNPMACEPATPPAVAPEAECPRIAGFSDWPGGRALRLDVVSVGAPPIQPLDPTLPVSFVVRGGQAGEEIHLFAGGLCGLDCPPDRDGACFQPIGPVELGVVYADAEGVASLELPAPDPSWSERWTVFQATGPARGAISQAWVDRVGDWFVPFVDNFAMFEVSPATLHALPLEDYEGNGWWWPVAPGRRVRGAYDIDYSWGYESADVTIRTAGGDPVTISVPPGEPFDAALMAPSSVTWGQVAYSSVVYTVDWWTEPFDAPVDWWPDADGDGWGDPSGAPIASTVPVSGRATLPTDCDDADPTIRPIGLETCGDGVDQDCDGSDRPCAGSTADAGVRYHGLGFDGIGTRVGAGDLDCDGITELVAAGFGVTNVYPLGRTDSDEPTAVLVGATDLSVGDLTGDGLADVLLVRPFPYSVAELYAGPLGGPIDPAAARAVRFAELYTLQPAIGDVTGDGVGDLVLADTNGGYDGEVAYFAGPLSGVVEPTGYVPIILDRHPRIAVGDADGDGIDDVWSHEACLYPGPDLAASVGCAEGGPGALGWGGLVAVDVDSDGYGDLVAGSGEGARWIQGPLSGELPVDDVTVASVEDERAGNAYTVAAVPDRDGDGFAEIVLGFPEEVWLVSGAPGTWGRADGEWVGDPSRPPSLLGGDFDGDGTGDLVVGDDGMDDAFAAYTGGATLLWGR